MFSFKMDSSGLFIDRGGGGGGGQFVCHLFLPLLWFTYLGCCKPTINSVRKQYFLGGEKAYLFKSLELSVYLCLLS